MDHPTTKTSGGTYLEDFRSEGGGWGGGGHGNEGTCGTLWGAGKAEQMVDRQASVCWNASRRETPVLAVKKVEHRVTSDQNAGDLIDG